VAQSLDHFWVVRNTSILVGGQHPDGNEVGAVDIGQRNPLRIAEQAPVQLDPRRPTPVLAIGLPLVPLADCQVAHRLASKKLNTVILSADSQYPANTQSPCQNSHTALHR
jgi:hypothetical protein